MFLQGCHASGKSQGNLKFFKDMELSGNFANCQGNFNCWQIGNSVRELSEKCQGILFLSERGNPVLGFNPTCNKLCC